MATFQIAIWLSSLVLWIISLISIITILLVEIKTFCFDLYISKIETKISQMQPDDKSPDPSASPSVNEHTSEQFTSTSNWQFIFLTFMLPLLAYLFSIFACINAILSFSNIGVANGCHQIGIFGITYYGTAKMFLYLVFVYRLFVVYSNSAFAYNNKILSVMIVMIVLCCLTVMIIGSITLHAIVYNTTINGLNIKGCKFLYSFSVLVTSAFIDIIISSMCCYLFIRPLLSLMKHTNERDNETKDIYNVVLKCTILTFVATTSTIFLLIIIGITKRAALTSIDYSINCICVMLFNKKYNKYFNVLCCGAIKICSKVSGKYEETNDQ
eukprot:6888_1